MKIRNGFVSNSSSSSFVVILPKEPIGFNDLKEFMFGKESGAINVYNYAPLTFDQIVTRVSIDIDQAKNSPAPKKDKYGIYYNTPCMANLDVLVDLFKYMYHYIDASDIDASDIDRGESDVDELGGKWRIDNPDLFGFDKKSLNKLRDVIIKSKKSYSEYCEKIYEITKKNSPTTQPYAYKGGNDRDGVPFTKKQINDYNRYQKALDLFRKTNKEYLKAVKEERKSSDILNAKENKLRKIIATKDAKRFLKNNKGAFIFVVNYGDEKGEPTLEHGNIFRNVKHIRISQH